MGGDQLTGGVELTGRDNWLGRRVDWGDHNLNKADRSNYACIYGDKIDGNIDANDRASKWNGWKADILLFLLLLLLLDCFDICHVGLFWRCERIVIRCYHKIRLQWETPTIENNSQQITIQSLETIIHNLRIFLLHEALSLRWSQPIHQKAGKWVREKMWKQSRAKNKNNQQMKFIKNDHILKYL